VRLSHLLGGVCELDGAAVPESGCDTHARARVRRVLSILHCALPAPTTGGAQTADAGTAPRTIFLLTTPSATAATATTS